MKRDRLTFEGGIYRTSGEKRPLLFRLMPNLMFYSHVLPSVISSGRYAKKGLFTPDETRKHCLRVFEAMELAGANIEITGFEHVESVAGPCVFIANHMSTFETFVLPAILHPAKDVTFVIKKSLTEYPVFGHTLRAMQAVEVTRQNPRDDLKAVMEQGTDLLSKGKSIIIFPQTTRVVGFDPEKFNSLGIKLALKAGVPVIPMALRTDAWAIGRIVKDFGKIDSSKPVRFAFGPPLELTGRGNDQHQAVMDFITSKLRQWEVI